MYEGYLQHDAQEVLQCILGYVQEACDTIRKEHELKGGDKDLGEEVKMENNSSSPMTESEPLTEEEGQVSGKRKSDTEVGNAKKKSKSRKSDTVEENVRNQPLTRSKRKSSSDITTDSTHSKDKEEEGTKKQNTERGSDEGGKDEKASKETDGKKKKRAKLSWLRPSGKQPSIFAKFRSVGKISSVSVKNQNKAEPSLPHAAEEVKAAKPRGIQEHHKEKCHVKLASFFQS